MSFRRVVLYLLLLAVAGPHALAEEKESAVSRILGEALRDDRAYQRLAWLADRIGARLSGSENLERAIEWAVAEMRDDGVDRVWTEPVMVPHWVRGKESGKIVAPREQRLEVLALGGTIATPPGGITAEVVEAEDFDELETLGDAVRGKIVLFNKEIFRNGGTDGKQGYGSAAGLRVRGAIQASKQGAVAMLLRSLGTADFNLPHTGMMRYEDGIEKIPAAAVAAEDAGLIHRLLAAGA
ncbi:MAG: peptidase M28 family protein, partial [Acidobacteriota bacterium]|nr:peptidase M28 family protein [Acidobacteriota bacterium]